MQFWLKTITIKLIKWKSTILTEVSPKSKELSLIELSEAKSMFYRRSGIPCDPKKKFPSPAPRIPQFLENSEQVRDTINWLSIFRLLRFFLPAGVSNFSIISHTADWKQGVGRGKKNTDILLAESSSRTWVDEIRKLGWSRGPKARGGKKLETDGRKEQGSEESDAGKERKERRSAELFSKQWRLETRARKSGDKFESSAFACPRGTIEIDVSQTRLAENRLVDELRERARAPLGLGKPAWNQYKSRQALRNRVFTAGKY